jgi:multiple sugar transport system ATP-binding protein
VSRIRAEALTKRYGAVTAVDRVSLDIGHGEFLVLLGPSGCGKSTLLRMLAGLVPPTEGRIRLDERDITAVPPRDRDLAMVFQSYALYPHLSVARNIAFPLRARKRPRAEIDRKVAEVAALLELTELLQRRPRALSGGQRQRVALARALVREPGAFLLDEPLSNLDAKLRNATRSELIELHRSLGATFVYVTHDQVEAMTMATRIALLNDGRLEQVGTPAEVYDEPASVFVAGFLGSPAMNLMPVQIDGRDGRLWAHGPGVAVPLPFEADLSRAAILGIRPEHLRVRRPGDPAEPMLAASVLRVENLGADELAHCHAGPVRLAVKGTRPIGLRPGDTVGLTVDAGHLHLFDPTSGRRLVWQPADVELHLPELAPEGATL